MPKPSAPMSGKRLFDGLLAGVGLVVLSPVMAVVAVLVAIRLGRPVVFRQERAGRDGRPFVLFKFRTMSDARSADGRLLPDDERLTPFGARLRSTSLDELPELYNVLRGDMSLVGPRPLPTRYLGRYTAEEARRHEVLPGLTGWSQVQGRNASSWDDRLANDVWYVDHRSFRLDLEILARTVAVVVRREGIAADGHVTMEDLPEGRTRRSG